MLLGQLLLAVSIVVVHLLLRFEQLQRVVDAVGEPKIGAGREDLSVLGEVEASVVVEQDTWDDCAGLSGRKLGTNKIVNQ